MAGALTAGSAGSRIGAVASGIAMLRQGMPVRISGYPDMSATAAETAEAVPDIPEVRLVMMAERAAALGHCRMGSGPVAFAFARHTTISEIHAAADPTSRATAAPLRRVGLPQGADVAVALAKLARLLPALLLTPARSPGVAAALTAADIRAYQAASAACLTRVSEANVPLEGTPDARMVVFRSSPSGHDHLAIIVGEPSACIPAPLVRVHSECFTGDLLGSLRCDCGPQLREALRRMSAEGSGVLLYLAQEGRGIGLANKLRAYALQDAGYDTVAANIALGFDADERDFAIAASMLRSLGLNRIKLLTNNPAKVASLRMDGVEVVSREELSLGPNGTNDAYLATKAHRLGHLLS
jgi:GTP cyclohydrolase II